MSKICTLNCIVDNRLTGVMVVCKKIYLKLKSVMLMQVVAKACCKFTFVVQHLMLNNRNNDIDLI